MVQLQCLDAHLDTLPTELYQVNVCVGRSARQQATMGGFALEATSSPPFVISDSDDDDASENDDDRDSSSTDEMST